MIQPLFPLSLAGSLQIISSFCSHVVLLPGSGWLFLFFVCLFIFPNPHPEATFLTHLIDLHGL